MSHSEGLALIELNKKMGFIDIEGNQTISCIYDNANDFSGGLALVKIKGKSGYLNNIGIQFWED